ncbi:MAG: hypothetical protein GDA56_16495 [Hormoscilla sp. GM7CHS1pb]|nr:hypothetical protein [Hormoscilla sp. GM7CHS1pb]
MGIAHLLRPVVGINLNSQYNSIVVIMSNFPDPNLISAMSQAGLAPDKGGLTKAGRAFEKHAQRAPQIWGSLQGDVQMKNQRGQGILEEIINSPDTEWSQRHHAMLKKEILEGKLPDGRGARWSANGDEFICFLSPYIYRSN